MLISAVVTGLDAQIMIRVAAYAPEGLLHAD
jgi:hypothetical protein